MTILHKTIMHVPLADGTTVITTVEVHAPEPLDDDIVRYANTTRACHNPEFHGTGVTGNCAIPEHWE